MKNRILFLIVMIALVGSVGAQNLSQDFEGTTFPPDGWTVIDGGDDNDWQRSATNGVDGSACAEIRFKSVAHDDYLICPQIIPATGNSTYSFYAKSSASYPEKFDVKLSTTGNNKGDFDVVLATGITAPAAYTQFPYDLSAYIDQNVYVAIVAISADKDYLRVDDVAGPPINTSVTILTATPSSLDFGYVASSSSTDAKEYILSGSNLTAGPIVVTAPTGFGLSLFDGGPFTSSVDVTYTVPTLDETTIYVQFAPTGAGADYSGDITNVGGGATSNVAVLGTSVQITTIWLEDFESGVFLPTGWTMYVAGAANDGWVEAGNTSHSPSHSAFHNYTQSTVSDDWLISPEFDLSLAVSPTLSYWEKVLDASYAETQNVLYSVNYNGSGDPAIADWVILNDAIGSDSWAERGSFTLPTNSSVYIAFQYGGKYASRWNIDDVTIEDSPTPGPTNSTWAGTTDNDWNTETNWSDGVPAATTAVTIPITGVTNFPTLTVAATVASVTMAEGATIVGAQHLTITGEFTYSKHLVWADEYHYLSSPVGAIDIADVFPEENINDICMYNYDESEQEWVAMDVVTPENNAFVNGMGYNIHRTTGSTLGSYDVTFNKTAPIVWADVPFTNLSVTGTVNNYSGWHLLGNPFPAAINWTSVVATLSNIENAVYVWDGDAGTYGSYISGIGITSNYLPVGQGFMVKATDATNSITLLAAAAVHDDASIYKASTSALRLDVTSTATSYHDATFVRFANGATTAYDNAFDARKLFGLEEAPALYTQIDEQTYSINAVNEEIEAIALNFHAGVDGSYTITATEIMSNGTATLEDLQTGETVELDATATYTFDATTVDDAERFVLHLKSTTGVDTQVENAANIYAFTNRVYVESQTSGEAMIYNVSGQLVRRMTVTKGLNSVVLDNGIYIVRLNATAQKVSVQ